MKKLSMKNQGFTLIELLIVVAIIGIIAGIAIPNFLGARNKARVSRAFADMRSIGEALETYYTDKLEYPDGTVDGNDLLAALTPDYITSIPRDPFYKANERTKLAAASSYGYYSDAAAGTKWLLVSNGPDGDADVTSGTQGFSWVDADRVAGQLGGPDGPWTGYGLNLWYNPSAGAGSTGDLGRSGP